MSLNQIARYCHPGVGRIILAVVGVIGALLATEAVLRIAGSVYRLDRHLGSRTAIPPPELALSQRVLCIGDSWTFGIGAPAGFSFPEQLAQRLGSDPETPVAEVINRGIPGANSSQILDRLEKELAEMHPQTVIILAGTNNSWNATRASIPPPWRSPLTKWIPGLEEMRVYRLLQMGWMGAQKRLRTTPEPQAGLWPMLKLHSDLSPRTAQGLLEELGAQPPSEEKFLRMGRVYLSERRIDEAIASFQEALAIHPHSEEAYASLALAHMGRAELDHAEELLATAQRLNPNSALVHAVQGVYYLWLEAFEQAHAAFQTADTLNPDVELSPMDVDAWVRPSDRTKRYLRRWLVHDLEAMVTLVDRHQARPVLLTYPSRDPGPHVVSRVIREVGTRHDVRVVDMEQMIDTFPDGARAALFVPNGLHLNAAGYQFVARRLAEELFWQAGQPQMGEGMGARLSSAEERSPWGPGG